MINKTLIDNIFQLFKKKEYNEVIIEIEKNFDINNIPPDLINLSAISKLLKVNNVKEDIFSALNDLEIYYKKSVKKSQKIEAVSNYISVCVVNLRKYNEIVGYFRKAEKLYEECIRIGIAKLKNKNLIFLLK